MRFLLDTHVLLWFALGSRKLSREQAAVLKRCEKVGELLGLSAITAFELAQLGAAGRLGLEIETLFERIDDAGQFEWLPLTPRVAVEATRLGPSFHRDPADQLIAATARVHGLKLLTTDEKIRESGVVEVV